MKKKTDEAVSGGEPTTAGWTGWMQMKLVLRCRILAGRGPTVSKVWNDFGGATEGSSTPENVLSSKVLDTAFLTEGKEARIMQQAREKKTEFLAGCASRSKQTQTKTDGCK